MTAWLARLALSMPTARKWLARVALVLIAIVAWIIAPVVVLVMWIGGGTLAKQRAADAADKADQTLNAITGNTAFRWLSQGAANNTGPGWRALAVLLKAGWPGHIERYRV